MGYITVFTLHPYNKKQLYLPHPPTFLDISSKGFAF